MAALQQLILKGLVGSVHPLGARVEKFRHNAAEVFQLGPAQMAVLAELLLRGPQQPGELRGRAARMAPIESLPALHDTLKPLLASGLAVRLDPAPGSRSERYAQTLTPSDQPVAPRAIVPAPPPAPAPSGARDPDAVDDGEGRSLDKRVADLEFNLSRLRRQLDNLAWKLGEKLEG